MYKWDKNYINALIKYLKTLEKSKITLEDIVLLKELKSFMIHKKNYNLKENIKNEKDEYKIIRHYNNIINPIIRRYKDIKYQGVIFNKIETTKKEILLFTRDNIKEINKKWAEVLEPWILSKYHINYKKNNENYVICLDSLEQYFISLEKNDNITDFINPTHEFLHIYTAILNYKSINSIESEFLSILGELITTHEMKNKNIYKNEVIKYEIDNINRMYEYIDDIPIRQDIIKNKNNMNIIYEKYKISKKGIKDIYCSSITYDYITIISYLIAIELFNIYKVDKEKCIFIAENIIKSNDKIYKKLKDNNIKLLTNDKNYIKQLKKEYVTINNQ